MALLSWISDEHLEAEVNKLLAIAKKAQNKATTEFGKNVIDPFAALFEMAGFGLDHVDWIKSETGRQAQKTLQNHIGDFHQNILGYCKGWENMYVGNVVDLVSHEYKIVAEIKNKYNTISGGKLSDLYSSLHNLIGPKNSVYKGFTAYYVAIIPKKPNRYNKLFIPSDKDKGEKCQPNELLREIDGASFYELVTGSKSALKDLFSTLPVVINQIHQPSYRLSDNDKLLSYYSSAFGE